MIGKRNERKMRKGMGRKKSDEERERERERWRVVVSFLQ